MSLCTVCSTTFQGGKAWNAHWESFFNFWGPRVFFLSSSFHTSAEIFFVPRCPQKMQKNHIRCVVVYISFLSINVPSNSKSLREEMFVWFPSIVSLSFYSSPFPQLLLAFKRILDRLSFFREFWHCPTYCQSWTAFKSHGSACSSQLHSLLQTFLAVFHRRDIRTVTDEHIF